MAAPGKGQGPHPFESFDKDGNKELSKEEVAAAPQIGGDFDVIDTDKSGSITKDELEAYRTAQHAQRMKSN
jgi:Ca2+-binding EF-hand superfamily protein